MSSTPPFTNPDHYRIAVEHVIYEAITLVSETLRGKARFHNIQIEPRSSNPDVDGYVVTFQKRKDDRVYCCVHPIFMHRSVYGYYATFCKNAGRLTG